MRIPNLHSLMQLRFLAMCGVTLAIAAFSTANAAPPPKAAKGKKAAAAPALAPPDMDRSASRFILPETQDAYFEKIRGQISMTKRMSDPFGRSQDPNAAPPVAKPNTPEGPKGPRVKINLEQALANLKITTVIPAEKRFILANGFSYQEGQSIKAKSRGKVIDIQVMAVKANEIVFRNAESGEVAAKKIKMLPPGMQPGTTLAETPGLLRSQEESPLNLDLPGQN